MKSHLFQLTLLICLTCTIARAEPPAGMVLYFESGSEVYLLIAEHANSQRGWAGFGGGGRVGESSSQTAAHKAEEESRGYFKRGYLHQKIADQKPVMDGEFAFYFAEIDFVPATRIQNHPVAEVNDAYLERSTFAWIPYSSLVPYLQQNIDHKRKHPIPPAFRPKGSQTDWFWPVWLSNMRQALLHKRLPWGQE